MRRLAQAAVVVGALSMGTGLVLMCFALALGPPRGDVAIRVGGVLAGVPSVLLALASLAFAAWLAYTELDS